MKYFTILLIFIISLNFISWLSTDNQFSIDAATFDAPLLPGSDNLHNLGSSASSQRWQNGFFSGNLTTAGNISIGTTTISEKLTVVDGNISNINNVPVRIGAITLNSGEDIGSSIAISGRYAYITTYTSPAKVVVIDISNPSNPIRVGAITLTGENFGNAIAISGRYAYIATWTNPARIVVVDISNPSSPTKVGAVALNSGEDGINDLAIAVSGRYAYITTYTSPARVVVVDVSNPSNPTRVGMVILASEENNGDSIAIFGRYAYITTDTIPARVVVIDVSNPSNPTKAGAVILNSGENSGEGITISGRYAYIATRTIPAKVVTVDISNPSNPTRVEMVDLAPGEDGADSIIVSGRYAYIPTYTTPTKIVTVDISNPSNPTRVGAVTLASGEDSVDSITMSGRYIYIVTNTSPARIVVIDIKGLEAVSANIHSLEAGNLQVRNDIIAQGQLQVTGGINVGTGGIFSAGPIGISISSTTQTDAVSAYFQGRVGIATTTPSQKLEVNGGIRLFTSDSEPTCNANLTRGTLWFTTGASGVADTLKICNSSSTAPGGYDWRKLY